jgi:hypothetical protein
MPAKNHANSGGASGEGSAVAVIPRHESREAVGPAAASEGRGGAGQSGAVPRHGATAGLGGGGTSARRTGARVTPCAPWPCTRSRSCGGGSDGDREERVEGFVGFGFGLWLL